MKRTDDYARARIRAIVRALEKYHQFQETDSLHRIRLEIKKLKGTLMLLGFVDEDFDTKESYRPLRKIFRQAGKIRQPSVMMELLLAHGMEGLPVESLGDSQKAKDKFRADTPFFVTRVKKLGRRLEPRWKSVRRKHITAYVKKLQRLIRRTFVPRLKSARLHRARKRLKKAIYLSRLTDGLKRKEVEFYSSLESAIGSLHDKEILLEFLSSLPGNTVSFEVDSIQKQATAERKLIGEMSLRYFRK